MNKRCKASLLCFLVILSNGKVIGQPFSTSPQGGSSTSSSGTLGVNRVTVTVYQSTSGSYAYGFRYTNSENGFVIAGSSPGSFASANQWTNPTITNFGKTVTFDYATNPYWGPGNCLLTAINPKLRLHITSTGTGHAWTNDGANGFISAPISGTGADLVFYVDLTNGAPNGTLPAAPTNWMFVASGSNNNMHGCTGQMFTKLYWGWFTLTPPFSTTPPSGVTNTSSTGTFSLNRVVLTVPRTSSGCYAYGLRYTTNENGFIVATSDPGTFSSSNNRFGSPVVTNSGKTLTLTYGSSNYSGGCMVNTKNPVLRLHITSTGSKHVWTINSAYSTVYAPIQDASQDLVIWIDLTNGTPQGANPPNGTAPNNFLVNSGVPGSTCSSSYSTYSKLVMGWFTMNAPLANPTITPSTACTGSTVNLAANATQGTFGNLIYSWTGPSSFTSPLASPSISSVSSANAGTYNLTITDDGKCSVTGSKALTVRPVPNATITVPATTPTFICAATSTSQTITATAVSSPEVGTWTHSGPSTVTVFPNTTASQTVTGMTGGTHVFTWTVTNDAPGCSDTESRTVGVNQIATYGNINGANEEFCEPLNGAPANASLISSTAAATMSSPSYGTFRYQWQYQVGDCSTSGTWIDVPGCGNVASCDPNISITQTVCFRRAVYDDCNNMVGEATNRRLVSYIQRINSISMVDTSFIGCGSAVIYPDSIIDLGPTEFSIVYMLENPPNVYTPLDTNPYYTDYMVGTKTIAMHVVSGNYSGGWCPSYDTTWVTSTVSDGFDVTVTPHNTKCYNENTGSAKAVATNGIAPYSFVWSSGTPVGSPADSVRNLTVGNYSLTVKDAADCATIVFFSITQPDLLDLTSVTSADISGSFNINCSGASTGSINITPSGGTTPYSYNWTGPGGPFSSQDLTNIASGTYLLTITDAKLCTKTSSFIITQPPSLSVQANVGYTCSGGVFNAANITLSGSGGVGGYNYSATSVNGPWGASNLFTNTTGGGNFTFWVRDIDSCKASVTVPIISLPSNNPGGVLTCDIIYVSPSGAGTLGTKSCPTSLAGMVSIFNSNPTRKRAYLAQGTYNPGTVLNIPNGIIIEGGFIPSGIDDKNWIKSSSAVTTINFSSETSIDVFTAHTVGMVFNSTGGSFKLQDVTINVSGPAGTTSGFLGKSVYGMHISNAGSFELIRCKITTGNASGGAVGTTGANGAVGEGRNAVQNPTGSCPQFTRAYDSEKDGGWGNCDSHDNNSPACLPSTYLAPHGGDGAEGSGNTTGGGRGSYVGGNGLNGNNGSASTGRGGGGGGGGAGGEDDDTQDDGEDGGNGGSGGIGAAGAAGAGGVPGGTGGSAGVGGTKGSKGGNFDCSCVNVDLPWPLPDFYECMVCGNPGNNGSTGGNGSVGGNGSTGPAGTFGSYFIPGGVGGTGGQGGGGGGGGGAGGGGGQTGWRVDDGSGGGGGAGAGGGGGGYGGTGGYGGGIALGMYLFSNTSARIDEIAINQGSGGTGGTGGAGGYGGAGGSEGGIGGLIGKTNGDILLDLGCLIGLIGCGCGNETGPGGLGGKGGNGGNGGLGGNGSNGGSYDLYVSNNALNTSPLFLPAGTNTLSLPLTTTYDPVKIERNQGCTKSSIYITKDSSPAGNWDLSILPGAAFIKDKTPTLSSFSASSDSAVIYFDPAVPPSSLIEYDLKINTAYYKEYVNLAVNRGTLDTITIKDNASGNHVSSVCSGALIEFKVLNSYAGYEWLIVESNSPYNTLLPTNSSAQTSTYTFSQTGTYHIRLRYREECCGWTIPIWKTFTVGTVPGGTPVITGYPTASPVFNYCEGATIGAEVTGFTNVTAGYSWTSPITTGQILSGSVADSISMLIGSSTGNIQVIAKNGCGNSAPKTQLVTVKPLPSAAILGPTQFCTGQTIILQNNNTTYPGYVWSPGGATTSSISVSAGGNYTVSVTAANGCSKVSPVHTVVDLGPDYVWTGLANTDNSWHNSINWRCGIPDKTKNVIIPTVPQNVSVNGSPNWPEVKSGLTGDCNTIVVETGAQLKIITTGTLNVNKP